MEPVTATTQHEPEHRDAVAQGIPVDAWNVCSKIFVEGRRMRALVGELQALDVTELSPAARRAVERYAHELASAASLGDDAADSIVAPRADDSPRLPLRPYA